MPKQYETYSLREHDLKLFNSIKSSLLDHVEAAKAVDEDTLSNSMLAMNTQLMILSEILGYLVGGISQDGSVQLTIVEQLKAKMMSSANDKEIFGDSND